MRKVMVLKVVMTLYLMVLPLSSLAQDKVMQFRHMSMMTRDRLPSIQESKDFYNGQKTLKQFVDEWLASSEHEDRLRRFFKDMFGSPNYVFLTNSEQFLESPGSVYQFQSVVKSSCNRDNSVSRIGTSGVVTTDLDGSYFVLPDQSGSVGFWIDVGNTGTSEPSHGASRAIEIAAIDPGFDENQVASAISAAIHADAQFESYVSGSLFVVIDMANGDRTGQSSGTSGFQFNVFIEGSASGPEATFFFAQGDNGGSLDGTYFIVPDAGGTVAVWFDIDDSGTAEPAHGATRSIEVSGVNTGDGPAKVMSRVYESLNADSAFFSWGAGSRIYITDAATGARSGHSSGTSGLEVVEIAPAGGQVSADVWWSDTPVQMCTSAISNVTRIDLGEGFERSCNDAGAYNDMCGCGPDAILCYPSDGMASTMAAVTQEFPNRAVWVYGNKGSWKDLLASDQFYGDRWLWHHYLYQGKIRSGEEPSAAELTTLAGLPIDGSRASASFPQNSVERAGVATMPAFLRQFNNMRSRIRAVTNSLLCKDVDSSLNTDGIEEFVNNDLSDFDKSHGTKEGCASCHFGLDNFASTLLGWSPDGFYQTWDPKSQLGHVFGETGTGPEFLMDGYIERASEFHVCMVKRVWEDFSGNKWDVLSKGSKNKFVAMSKEGPHALIQGIIKSSEISDVRKIKKVVKKSEVKVTYDFNKDINPILASESTCGGSGCHGKGTSLGSGYEFEDNEANFKKAPKSRLLDGSMPPLSSGKSISDEDRDKLILFLSQ